MADDLQTQPVGLDEMRRALIDPPWLRAAWGDVGKRETSGPNDAPWLRQMLANLRASWLIGQPWCGSIMARWMRGAGLPYPSAFYRALAWAEWGVHADEPYRCGTVVVLKRPGGGHVGILVGQDVRGRLVLIGGNVGDAVAVAPFERDRVIAYRWPAEAVALQSQSPLPTTQLMAGESSRNEA